MRKEINIALLSMYYTTHVLIMSRYQFKHRYCLQFLLLAYYIQYYEKVRYFNKQMVFDLLKPAVKTNAKNYFSFAFIELIKMEMFEKAIGLHSYYRMTAKGKAIVLKFVEEFDVLELRNSEYLKKQAKIINKKLDK